MIETHFAITVLIGLLLVASAVAMATRWIRVPYTLLLVIVGLIISPMHFLPAVQISPELILLIFLPALLFEASWNLKFEALRENAGPILALAIPGVVVSVGVVGTVLHFGVQLAWPSALLFGCMISATDPVSVLALFRRLRLPERLTTVVEGESLFNDGTAVAVFQIVLGIAAGTTTGTFGELAALSVRGFLVVAIGGVLVGTVVGLIASTLTAHFDDHLLEITLTTTSAYGAYLLADGLHVSPVIAVLGTGLFIGNYGRVRGMSATTQLAVNSFWEYAAFVVNSLVFLLIGLEIHLSVLSANLVPILWAVLAMLAGRVVAVYGLMPWVGWFDKAVPARWQHVLVWGGLRGSLSIALVLSLPTALPGRSQLVVMIFGTVIFSLLAQGLTLSPLLRWLGLGRPEVGREEREYEFLQGQLLADTAALVELEDLRRRGMITGRLYEALKANLAAAHPQMRERLQQLDQKDFALEHQQFRRVKRHLLDVKKARLSELVRQGLLSPMRYDELNQLVDEELADLRTSEEA
ncbi:MAG TPA: Na+/H+ antiporter [Vicinamibacterales bacterium]|nr:Na+/H+ antiporter [Vicinamibacterales bacterium]